MLLGLFSVPVSAHTASDSYLLLEANEAGLTAKWDVALRDLDFALGLDSDFSGDLTWGEVKARHSDISAFMFSGIVITRGGGACVPSVTDQMLEDHAGDTHASLLFVLNCGNASGPYALTYDLMFDIDLSHRGLVRFRENGTEILGVTSPDNRVISFAAPRAGAMFAEFTLSGFDHIIEGYDHILFLLVLLFSAVLAAGGAVTLQRKKTGQRVSQERRVFVETVKILTAFTLAHAVTLTIAQLYIVPISSAFVESAIALSIVVAALDNFRSFLGSRKWLIAFSFGLIHGFGFAGALGSIELSGWSLAVALVGFNVGIELGQIMLAVAALVILYVAVRAPHVRNLSAVAGSGLAALMGAYWFVERAF